MKRPAIKVAIIVYGVGVLALAGCSRDAQRAARSSMPPHALNHTVAESIQSAAKRAVILLDGV